MSIKQAELITKLNAHPKKISKLQEDEMNVPITLSVFRDKNEITDDC